MKLVSLSPYRLAPTAQTVDTAPVRTALRWAAFAYLLRRDRAFAARMERRVLAQLDDYAALIRDVQQALDTALPWLAPLADAVQAEPVVSKFTAFAQKLDLIAGEVVDEGRQTFAAVGFVLPWAQLEAEQRRWLRQAMVSWSEALFSLEIRALNQTFADYAPFAIDLKQQLKQPDAAALYVEPEALEEELWIACARLPAVRRHLERLFGKGRQVRTVWALPARREIANWLVADKA